MLTRVPSAAAWLPLLPRRLRAPASRSVMTPAASLHHVFVPAKTRVSGRPPPLVVLLHGTGADEHDLLDAGEQLQQAFGGELAVASLRAPLSLGYGGYAWFEGYSFAPERRALEHTVRGAAPKGQQRRTDAGPELFALTDSASRVIAFLEAAPATLGTDPERAALFCFSQGATIGWTVSTSVWPRPGLLKGACLLRCARCCEQNGCVCAAHLTLVIVICSGRLFPEHGKATLLAAANAPAAELRSRSIWVTHGEADGTTPVALARESMQTAATLFGGDDAAFAQRVLFEPHAGGHEIPRTAMRNAAAALKRWFV